MTSRLATGSEASAARDFAARAVLGDGVPDDLDIRSEELSRARHALAYLKARIGDDLMHKLLGDDVARTTAQARAWVSQSRGSWRSAQIDLVVRGPTAQAFHRWYEQAMASRREDVLRAGHPEHFVLHSGDKGIEVVENIGETDLPWRVVYRPLPDDAFPSPWDEDFPTRFGAEIVDAGGVRVGYTMHQLRDDGGQLRLRLRTLLPDAAPPSLLDRHLRHFAIEFTNWTEIAWRESCGGTQP